MDLLRNARSNTMVPDGSARDWQNGGSRSVGCLAIARARARAETLRDGNHRAVVNAERVSASREKCLHLLEF